MSMRQTWLRKVAEKRIRHEIDEMTLRAICDAVREHSERIVATAQALETRVIRLLARRADQRDNQGHPV